MLRENINYPYPVLRTEPVDFVSSIFHDEIDVETKPDGYTLKTNFYVTNDEISELVRTGVLSYAVFISCKSTLLRKMVFITPENPNIDIDVGDVHYQVNFGAYLIAADKIDNYQISDFAEEYKDIRFKLKKGDIVGIGTEKQFNALFDKDIIHDASSIIRVISSDQEKYMRIDLDSPQINVLLPSDQCALYKGMQGSKKKYSLLHAVVTIPALMEAITVISTNNDDEMAQRPWYITLQKQVSDLSKLLNESEDYLYENPTRTVQILMENNSEAALKLIDEVLI